MCNKMAISAYILKIYRKRPISKASNESKGRFQSSPIFFSTNKQYVKIKLIQNETNRWSIFFGKDEILV